MVSAPLATNRDRAGLAPKASLADVPSQLAALDANRKGRRHSAFSRGHHVHVVSNQPKEGVSAPSKFDLTPSDLLFTCRGLRGSGLSHSRSDARTSRCCVRQRVCCSLQHTRVHSHDLTGANRSVVHSTVRQHRSYRLADVMHFSSLSSSAVSVGIDPNENGLTHAQIPFAPGAKAND